MNGCPPLAPKEISKALQNLRGRYRWRNRALVVLGIYTGLRASELLGLRVGDLYSGSSIRSRIYVPRRITKGKRRGDSIVLHPRAAAAVTKWIEDRGEGVVASAWLFPSQMSSTRPLGRKSAWEILHRAFVTAGVDGMAGSGCLRKTFAQNVYTALEGDLFRLSAALRHASPLTTLSYLSFRQVEIDKAILRT